MLVLFDLGQKTLNSRAQNREKRHTFVLENIEVITFALKITYVNCFIEFMISTTVIETYYITNVSFFYWGKTGDQ